MNYHLLSVIHAITSTNADVLLIGLLKNFSEIQQKKNPRNPN